MNPICGAELQGTKDAGESFSLESMAVPLSLGMEHENMDSEDYLLQSGLSDDDDDDDEERACQS